MTVMILLSATMILLIGCGPDQDHVIDKKNVDNSELTNNIRKQHISFYYTNGIADGNYIIFVLEIEGCEYIIYQGNDGNMIHKQNCKFCYERSKTNN